MLALPHRELPDNYKNTSKKYDISWMCDTKYTFYIISNGSWSSPKHSSRQHSLATHGKEPLPKVKRSRELHGTSDALTPLLLPREGTLASFGSYLQLRPYLMFVVTTLCIVRIFFQQPKTMETSMNLDVKWGQIERQLINIVFFNIFAQQYSL